MNLLLKCLAFVLGGLGILLLILALLAGFSAIAFHANYNQEKVEFQARSELGFPTGDPPIDPSGVVRFFAIVTGLLVIVGTALLLGGFSLSRTVRIRRQIDRVAWYHQPQRQ